LIGSAVFAQLMVQSPYTSQWAAPFPPQNCPFTWGIWTPCNRWFLGPIWIHSPNGISIGLAIYALLTAVTDRQTDSDHATLSVTIGSIYST